MLSIEALRKIDPSNTINLTDKEIEDIRQSFYDFGQLIFEDWKEVKFGSKNPVGSLTIEKDRCKIIINGKSKSKNRNNLL